jgi:hypothetical protein
VLLWRLIINDTLVIAASNQISLAAGQSPFLFLVCYNSYKIDHTNYYYFMKDWSYKLLLFHARLIIRIIIIACKIDHTNYYYFIQDWIIQIIKLLCKIRSHNLINFHTKLDLIINYYFIQDWAYKLFNFHARLDHTNYCDLCTIGLIKLFIRYLMITDIHFWCDIH